MDYESSHAGYAVAAVVGRQAVLPETRSRGVTCRDAKAGKVRCGPVRLPGIAGVFASPVGTAGRIYIVGRNGRCVVIKHGASFEVLAVNRLDDFFSASPVVVGNELYLRGERSVYCVATTSAE